MPGKGCFGTTGQTTHIDIEHLKAGLIVMRVTLTLLAINAVDGLFHLLHMLCWTGMQRVLHHRLLSTAAAPESSLQAHIGSQSRIDLDQSMGTGQDADQGVIKFVAWPILDGLLSNLHLLCNRLKELQFGQLDATAARLALPVNVFVATMVDSFMMMMLLSLRFHFSIGMPHHPAFGKLLSGGSLPLIGAKFR